MLAHRDATDNILFTNYHERVQMLDVRVRLQDSLRELPASLQRKLTAVDVDERNGRGETLLIQVSEH